MDYSGAFESCLLGDDDGEEANADDDPSAALLKVTAGKWKGGVVQRDACRQRVHRLIVEPITRRIVVFDSLFPRNRLALNVTSTGGGGVDDGVKSEDVVALVDEGGVRGGLVDFVSDKYNVYGDTSIAAKR